jgi:serine/threonine-protein kinase RsbW
LNAMAENQGGENQDVETLLDSTLESVDEAEGTVLRMAGGAGLEEDDLHALGMAVREAAVNAVVHGNRYNAKKKVLLKVSRAPDRLTIVIADEGEGFEVNSIPDPLASENLLRQSGRGLLLIRAFVDEFELRPREPRGTEVRLVKYLAKAS